MFEVHKEIIMKKYPSTPPLPQGVDSDFMKALERNSLTFRHFFLEQSPEKVNGTLSLQYNTAKLAAALNYYSDVKKNIDVVIALSSAVLESGSIEAISLVEAKLNILQSDTKLENNAQERVMELLQQVVSKEEELKAIDQQINDFKKVPTKDETRASELAVLKAARSGDFDALLRYLINPDADLNITNCRDQNVFDVLLEEVKKADNVDKLNPYIRCMALLLCEDIPINKYTAKIIGENYKKPLFYALQNNLRENGVRADSGMEQLLGDKVKMALDKALNDRTSAISHVYYVKRGQGLFAQNPSKKNGYLKKISDEYNVRNPNAGDAENVPMTTYRLDTP